MMNKPKWLRALRARELARKLGNTSRDLLWYCQTPWGQRRSYVLYARAQRLAAFANRIG